MPVPIIIDLTPQAQAVMLKLQRFPLEMGQAIKRGMDDAGNTAWHEITLQRFSGKGPYPVVEHKLGSRTERLKQSLFYRLATVATVGSNVAVTGTMGSYGVKYFPWHEYGKLVPPHVRLIRPKRIPTQTKRLKVVYVKGYNIPARAPLHHGIQDHKILFQTKIQQELEKTLNAKP